MTTTRTALPLPTMDDVLRDLNAGEPETVALIAWSMVRPGPPDGIDWDDPTHLAQRAARDRECWRGAAIAAVLIAALVWFVLIGGPDILLSK